MKAARDTWVNPVVALSLCAAGGFLFSRLKTPLPWMIGPLLAMAACNFAGAQLRAVPGSRQLGQLVIGTALGLYFTPLVARVDRIALAQSLRILVVVLVVPFALTYTGVHGSDAYSPAPVSLDWPKLALLLGIGAAGGPEHGASATHGAAGG